jgi:PPOX class probable F420-dependent enzyme
MVAPALEPFVRQWAVLLTTYRRDGRPVGAPVSIAVDEDRAFVRTWDTSGKFKRIRNNPEVEVAPSTVLGRATGPAIHARARVLEGDESARRKAPGPQAPDPARSLGSRRPSLARQRDGLLGADAVG